jgi:hypothetical protein
VEGVQNGGKEREKGKNIKFKENKNKSCASFKCFELCLFLG